MAYQQFQNREPTPQSQPTISSAAGTQHQNTATVVAGVDYPTSPEMYQPVPYNPFSEIKAQKTKILGIAILTVGTITFLLLLVVTRQVWVKYSSVGILTGIFIIIAGSFAIAAGDNKNIKCLRIAALVMCILAMIFAFSIGIMNAVAFGNAISDDCDDWVSCITKGDSMMSLCVALLTLVASIITLIATTKLGSGCCTSSTNREAVIIQQGQQLYVVPTSSTNNYHYQQQPQGGSYPGVPTYLQPPIYAQSHKQQHDQATVEQGGVSHGEEYNQQQQQLE